jgi:predicted PurR-regulated permease PerM
MLVVLGSYVALNQINNYVITPRLMSGGSSSTRSS